MSYRVPSFIEIFHSEVVWNYIFWSECLCIRLSSYLFARFAGVQREICCRAFLR